MTGIIRKTDEGWKLEYSYLDHTEIGVDLIKTYYDIIEKELDERYEDAEVEFNIKYYWEDGMKQPTEIAELVLIKDQYEYPELEGTMALCKEMIGLTDEEIEAEASKYYDNNGADVMWTMGAKWCREILRNTSQNQNVPTPDEELQRVKQAKNDHVKANNWEIAALYREIEKLLSKHAQTASFAKTGKMTEEEWQEAERQQSKKK